MLWGRSCVLPAGSVHREKTQVTGSKPHMPEIEMLRASLSPPFISPGSPGTAPGDRGNGGGHGQAAQGKTRSRGEAGSDLPAPPQLLLVKTSLLQRGAWPFLFSSRPSHTGICSHIVSVLCRCLPPSHAGTRSLQLVARAPEQRSHDALLASVFTVLCKGRSRGLC